MVGFQAGLDRVRRGISTRFVGSYSLVSLREANAHHTSQDSNGYTFDRTVRTNGTQVIAQAVSGTLAERAQPITAEP